ncbi:MAG: hypothetical protein M5U12_27705 [Verrucomicrobia bacterium]|nr:hypothetical protein [Verrucomicrobiota bacterium]
MAPEDLEQPVHGGGVGLVVEGGVRTDDLAAVIRGDLQALERPGDLLFDGLEPDVVDQDVQRMADGGVAFAAEPDRLEGVRDGLAHGRVLLEVVLGLVEDEVAGAARREDLLEAALLRDGEVAGGGGAGLAFIHGHVGSGAATVPVVQFLQLDAEMLHHRQEGLFVGLAGALEEQPGKYAYFMPEPSGSAGRRTP